MLCDPSVAFDLLVEIHLTAWAVACVLAFGVYYCFDECRMNPEFDNQLHCLSGVILFNKPLFGTLMCGFGGAVVLAVAKRAAETCDTAALVMLKLMFVFLLVVVNYDIRDHRVVHFTALGGLVVAGTLFVLHTAIASMYLQYVYFGTTALFAGVIFLNATVTKWTSPYMTLQALNEIAWVFFLGLYVFVYALVEPGR
jgi:hypothetical protein